MRHSQCGKNKLQPLQNEKKSMDLKVQSGRKRDTDVKIGIFLLQHGDERLDRVWPVVGGHLKNK
jgi:hypothetical protein